MRFIAVLFALLFVLYLASPLSPLPRHEVGAFYVPEERALYTFKDMAWSRSLKIGPSA